MKIKGSNAILKVFLVTLFWITYIQAALAQYPFNDLLSNPPEQTEVVIYLDHQSPFISDVFYKQNNWIPVRSLLKNQIDGINWDENGKIAYFINHDKELVFNFSAKTFIPNKDQILVPKEYSKLIDGRTCIDGLWLGWIFDMYATIGTDSERDNLRKELEFLDIQKIDMPYESIPKDKCLHLNVYFKK